MRVLFNVFLIVALFNGTAQKNNKILRGKNDGVKSSKAVYEIVRIDSIKNVYLIYGKKNDSIFKIVSSKTKIQNCIPIKEGDTLELVLKSSFRENFYQRKDITGVNYNGVLIRFDKTKDVVWDLFTTENIKGICYIK